MLTPLLICHMMFNQRCIFRCLVPRMDPLRHLDLPRHVPLHRLHTQGQKIVMSSGDWFVVVIVGRGDQDSGILTFICLHE